MKKRGKKAVAMTITNIMLILISLVAVAGVTTVIVKQVKESSEDFEIKLEAISNINLEILGVYINNTYNFLEIEVQNTGKQEISSFIVKIVSTENEVYFNDSVYLLNKEKLGPLNTRSVIIIPTPFGIELKNYKIVQVIPKFEINGQEEIAETAKDEFSGKKISYGGGGGSGGGFIPGPEPEPDTQCSDGIDNDNDGYIDLDDLGCSDSEDDSENTLSECRLDFSDITGNLILNPNLECDTDEDEAPDNWLKGSDDENHILSWIDDPTGTEGERGKLLKSEFTGTGEHTWFNWYQTIENIKPDTWYEFSVSIADQDLVPIVGPEIFGEMNSSYLGAGAVIYNNADEKLGTETLWTLGPELINWDESAWVYRTYRKKDFEGWRTLTRYFKTPPETDYITIRTYTYAQGILYAENFTLKEVPGNYNPEIQDLKKSGTLEFIKYKGEDFFPIVLYCFPEQNGEDINIQDLKSLGFNTVSHGVATHVKYKDGSLSEQELKDLFIDEDLAVVILLVRLFYKQEIPDVSTTNWVNDPNNEIRYYGASYIRQEMDNWADYENLLLFQGLDELDCHSARDGSYIPELRSSQAIYDYMKDINSDLNIHLNFCGRDYAYTGTTYDKADYYFPQADIITYTCNTPLAYPTSNTQPKLNKIGELVRWGIDASLDRGNYKPTLAFGLGVYDWSSWDYVGSWEEHPDGKERYIPFNLQRFQIFNQIINRAVGAWFNLQPYVDANDEYYGYNWQQISALATELSSLYPILIEPKFYDDWEVSDNRVEIMMKKHNNKIYLLTTLAYYEDVEDVEITITDSEINEITSVTAINDVINGDFENPVNREISINADKISFTDDFIGDYDATPQNHDTPGYSVHIYEIEYN